MRTVDDFAAIRPAHRDGLRIRQIARKLAVGRGTVRKALNKPEPRPHTLSRPRPAPTFGPFRGFVDAILAQDETAPRKQRHTASQVFRRLRATYGYAGGYTLFLPIRQAAQIYSRRGLGTIEQELLGPRSPRWALIPPDGFSG